MIDKSKGFTIVREFDATPQEIWQAWTDPDEMAQWFHPAETHTPRESVTVDLTVGGSYRYTMVSDASGEEVVTAGVYQELVENERLVFTWGEPGADPDDTPVVTVTIELAGDLTRMTFDLRGAEGARGDDSFYDGWDSALDELASHLGQPSVAG